MSTRRSLDCVLALLLAAAPAMPGWTAADSAAERLRIAEERARIEAQARDAQAACAGQFAVTACADRVRAERRERMLRLDHDRAVLDGEERKRRAAERQARLERRQAEAAAPPAAQAKARQPKLAPGGTAAPAVPASLPAPAQHARAASAAAAQAAQRAAASARRASEAAAHRVAVEQRLRERSAQRAPAKPLPIPASAAR